jgi:hypothetical protein
LPSGAELSAEAHAILAALPPLKVFRIMAKAPH